MLDFKNKSKDKVDLFWSVADTGTIADWPELNLIYQPKGSLSTRLSSIYSSLIAENDIVILLGADTPQITPDILSLLVSKIKNSSNNFCIGPALDGGFYAFCGSKPLNNSVWDSVEYSAPKTCEQLYDQISKIDTVSKLNLVLSDVDYFSDFKLVLEDFTPIKTLPKQRELIGWMNNFKKSN